MIMKFIHVPTFLISLAIGIFLVYISVPPVKIIRIMPTPDNVKDVQYKNKSGTCFAFVPNETKCPANTKMIHNYHDEEKEERDVNAPHKVKTRMDTIKDHSKSKNFLNLPF